MADEAPIRVLVIDDEPLGRRRIEDLLKREPGVEIVGAVGDGRAAIVAIRTLQPDLVFLDVQMPGMTGLELAREVGDDMPPTIFVTAYDQHAVAAFELAAVDYLVKPFDDDRFDQAFQRARRMLTLEQNSDLHERLLRLLQGGAPAGAGAPAAPSPGQTYLERIPVEGRGQVRFVPVSSIDCIVASGPYAELVVGRDRHLIRETMHALEAGLDPAKFMRIHRSTIVAIDAVDTLLRGAGGDYEVKLRNGVVRSVARSRREELERRLGMRG